MAVRSGSGRTSLQIYRDVMRLIKHIAGARSAKATQLRSMARHQFGEQRDLTDEHAIAAAKGRAEGILSNYMLFEQSRKDATFGSAAGAASAMPEFIDGADGVTYEVRSEEPLARRSQASPSDDEDLSEDEWTETEASGSSDDSDSFDDSDSDLLASDDSGGDEPIRRRAANMDGVDGRVVVVEEDAGEGEHRR